MRTLFDRLRVTVMAALVLGAGVAGPVQAWADACEEAHDPSPRSGDPTGIDFFNDTQFAYRILWIDFDGFLKEYGLLQPGEHAHYDTYIGHQWLVELYASEERTECFGPIAPRDHESCQAHILWNDGIGIDAGFCDF